MTFKIGRDIWRLLLFSPPLNKKLSPDEQQDYRDEISGTARIGRGANRARVNKAVLLALAEFPQAELIDCTIPENAHKLLSAVARHLTEDLQDGGRMPPKKRKFKGDKGKITRLETVSIEEPAPLKKGARASKAPRPIVETLEADRSMETEAETSAELDLLLRQLAPREREVLEALRVDSSRERAAKKLGIEPVTVRVVFSKAKKKLQGE